MVQSAVLSPVDRNFPGGPVAKTRLSHTGAVGLVPGWGTGIPCCTTQTKKKKYIYVCIYMCMFVCVCVYIYIYIVLWINRGR